MSDLLSVLRYDEYEPMAPWEQAWNAALDDVREALRSDKWKRLIAADLCEHEGVGKACIDCTFKAESVQKLLAGDKDDG